MDKERNKFLVSLLSIAFGIGTWLVVNGVWVELPLLVHSLPEGWTLPSYLAVIIQIANVGPILYTTLNSSFPRIFSEKRSIYFVMGLALASLILLVVFWSDVVTIGGRKHSIPFFVLVFILAAVDCSSRVMYLPFMAKFRAHYLTCFFIGEGLSGFIPSVFSLIQGAGGSDECVNVTLQNGTVIRLPGSPQPLFSIEVFFYSMILITVLSALAFYLLNEQNIVKNSLAGFELSQKGSEEEQDLLFNRNSIMNYSSTDTATTVPEYGKRTSSGVAESSVVGNEFICLMILITLISSLANGLFPSIQSYSCLPYGNDVYHWTVTLSSIANPAVCFLLLFYDKPSKKLLGVTSVAALAVGSYILWTALRTLTPDFRASLGGQILLVASWVFLVALFTYGKVTIATIMRSNGERGLFWIGVFTQFGSALGAIVAFVAVNFTHVFRTFSAC